MTQHRLDFLDYRNEALALIRSFRIHSIDEEDAFQEACLRMWTYDTTHIVNGSIKPYFLTVIRNVCNDAWKDMKLLIPCENELLDNYDLRSQRAHSGRHVPLDNEFLDRDDLRTLEDDKLSLDTIAIHLTGPEGTLLRTFRALNYPMDGSIPNTGLGLLLGWNSETLARYWKSMLRKIAALVRSHQVDTPHPSAVIDLETYWEIQSRAHSSELGLRLAATGLRLPRDWGHGLTHLQQERIALYLRSSKLDEYLGNAWPIPFDGAESEKTAFDLRTIWCLYRQVRLAMQYYEVFSGEDRDSRYDLFSCEAMYWGQFYYRDEDLDGFGPELKHVEEQLGWDADDRYRTTNCTPPD